MGATGKKEAGDRKRLFSVQAFVCATRRMMGTIGLIAKPYLDLALQKLEIQEVFESRFLPIRLPGRR